MAACRVGDTIVVTKLDRLVRPLPKARAIAEDPKRKGRPSLDASMYDPTAEVHVVELLRSGQYSTAELGDVRRSLFGSRFGCGLRVDGRGVAFVDFADLLIGDGADPDEEEDADNEPARDVDIDG